VPFTVSGREWNLCDRSIGENPKRLALWYTETKKYEQRKKRYEEVNGKRENALKEGMIKNKSELSR
jgi:hypothetical protein